MRIWTRVSLAAASSAVTALALAAPAFAASPGSTLVANCNHLPEVPYAALIPAAGIGVALLLHRRRARAH